MISPRQGCAILRLIHAQRRLMRQLADRVNRPTHADRLFFECWPDRQRHKPPSIPPGLSHIPEIQARLRKAAGTPP